MYQLAQVFKSPAGAEIRTVVRDGEPWFVAQDVCSALDVGNPSQACVRLDPDEKGIISTDTLGGQQDMVVVSESGLYCLVLGSRKPEAKTFRKWVTAEVLPTLRKTGSYHIPQDYPAALRAVADLSEKVQLLTGEGVAMCFRDVASHLGVPEREMLSFLKTTNVIYKAGGVYRAYSRYARYFQQFLSEDGKNAWQNCKVKASGLDFLRKKLKKLK